MHCNLKPSDVALVVLDINYEAHNAAAYRFKPPRTNRPNVGPPTRQISTKSNGGVTAI